MHHAGDRRQVVDDVLGDQKGQIERRQPDRDDDQQYVEIARDAVNALQHFLH